jgi:predicted Zn-dependent protease
LGNAGIYTQLHFGREMERTADEAALAAVNRLYGHVGGADDLFEVMHEARERAGAEELPAVFSSHPLDHQRLQAIADTVRAHGWSDSGATTPLPAQFSAWKQESAERAEARKDSE